jgi:D-tyrosyl-tRNA(Tyr) deacylase
MKVVIQRSGESYVDVDNKTVGKINFGFVVLVGFTHDDNIDDIKYIVKKIVNLRVFDDSNGVMNLSIKDIKGKILSISQFTLYADTKKGNRPSYINAMNSNDAKKLYEYFNEELRCNDIEVETGVFGSDMDTHINNCGPVTILIDSKER